MERIIDVRIGGELIDAIPCGHDGTLLDGMYGVAEHLRYRGIVSDGYDTSMRTFATQVGLMAYEGTEGEIRFDVCGVEYVVSVQQPKQPKG